MQNIQNFTTPFGFLVYGQNSILNHFLASGSIPSPSTPPPPPTTTLQKVSYDPTLPSQHVGPTPVVREKFNKTYLIRCFFQVREVICNLQKLVSWVCGPSQCPFGLHVHAIGVFGLFFFIVLPALNALFMGHEQCIYANEQC